MLERLRDDVSFMESVNGGFHTDLVLKYEKEPLRHK